MISTENLRNIIRDEIQKNSIEFLKKKKKNSSSQKKNSQKKKKTDYDKVKEKEDVDNALFYGGEDPGENKRKKGKLSEAEKEQKSQSTPAIQRSEIDNFAKEFSQYVTPNVRFDKDKEGNINFELYSGDSGTEAKISGIIPLQGEKRIKWEYSIQNGPYIDMRAELNDQVANIIKNLNNYYTKWKDEWLNKLSF